jgi:methyltransferase-like protein 6
MGDLLVKKSESLLKTLTNEEDLRLANSTEISEFKKQELEKNAQKNWERFYKRNSNHFFKVCLDEI